MTSIEIVRPFIKEGRIPPMPKPASRPGRALDDHRLCTLVAAIASRRDKQAFAELFRIYAPKLKAYAMRGGADEQAAEEVAQEAMISLWRKADSFDRSKASVSTWLFTIVRNKRIDMLRREARPDLKEEDFLHLDSEPTGADEMTEAKQTGRMLTDRIKELPADQAHVLKLAYFQDKSHRVIADELDLPLGTVKSRIRLALSRLKLDLAETLS